MSETANLRRALLADEVERDRIDRAVRNGRTDLTAARDATAAAAETTRALLADAIAAEPRIWIDDQQRLPAVLVPMRVEIKYLTGAAGPELGVRAVPDDIAVHTFEPELTDAEHAAGLRYWTSVTAADATPESKRDSWTTILAALGLARAAWTVEAMRPIGAQPDGAPILPAVERRGSMWTKAASSLLLPTRLNFRGWRHDRVVFDVTGLEIPDDLALGPDPAALGARPDDAAPDDPLLAWRGRSEWMVNFDEAVLEGMAVRVPLSGPDLGLDEVVVVGIAPRSGFEDTRRLAETMRGHLYTRGLAFPAPGSPTNNTDATRAAWSSAPHPRPPDEVAAGIADARSGSSQPGVVLADVFGFSTAPPPTPGRRDLLAATGSTDRDDAPFLRRARQLAVTAVTDFAFTPPPTALGWIDGANSSRHFVDLVDVEGPLPTVRVGRQPYGVLPVTSLTLWNPLPPQDEPPADPPGLGDTIEIGPPSPDGLHAFPDVPRSVVSLLRRLRAALALQLPAAPRFGDRGDQIDVLFDLYRRQPNAVALRVALAGTRDAGTPGSAPVGGDAPQWTWEDADIVALTAPGTPSVVDPTHGNVLTRLRAIIDQFQLAADAWDGVGDEPPVSAQVVAEYTDFVKGNGGTLEDTAGGVFWALALPLVAWGTLLGPGMIVARRKEEVAGHTAEVTAMTARIDAMLARFDVLDSWVADVLADQGRVDHAFARATEGLTTRVDAWWTSVATARLRSVRTAAPVGLHVGMYGVVTDVHPTPPAVRKAAEGWVLTPSIHHATTTAVLHSGWEARQDPAAFAVDLTSRRMRRALDVLAGLRNGRTLEELLGYQLERDLHDAFLDHLIPPMRESHPLAAIVTAGDDGALASVIAERLVADGESARRAGQELAAQVVAAAQPGELPAVRVIVADLDDTVDAIGDVLLAEAVHHLVGGAPLRAGLTVDTIGKANAVPDRIDVLRTSRRSVSVSHALAFAAHIGSGVGATIGWVSSPRATLDPMAETIAGWALGEAGDWTITITGDDGQTDTSSLADAAIAAIDVVAEADAPMNESALAARLRRVRGVDGAVVVRRTDGVADGDAIGVLCRHVRQMLAAARPALSPNELLAPVARPSAAVDLASLAGRVTSWWAEILAQLPAWPDGTADEQAAAIGRLADLGVAGVRADAEPSVGGALRARWPATTTMPANDLAAKSGPELIACLGALRAAVTAVTGSWVILAPEWTASQPGWDALGGTEPSGGAAVDDDAVDEWLHDHLDVRAGVSTVADVLQLVLACGSGRRRWIVRQSRPAPDRLGGDAVEGWVAREHPGPRAAMHLAALEVGDPLGEQAAGRHALVTVDQWVETLPAPVRSNEPAGVPEESAALAFRFDRPDARAPQAVLVAVPPDVGRGWRLEDLHAVVDETLWWAKARALDGDDVPELRWVLP